MWDYIINIHLSELLHKKKIKKKTKESIINEHEFFL